MADLAFKKVVGRWYNRSAMVLRDQNVQKKKRQVVLKKERWLNYYDLLHKSWIVSESDMLFFIR